MGIDNGLEIIEETLKKCAECDTVLTYRGLGEFYCPTCDKTIYNDYGKVRNYIEAHPSATVNDISLATNVPRSTIRRFVDQERFVETTQKSLQI